MVDKSHQKTGCEKMFVARMRAGLRDCGEAMPCDGLLAIHLRRADAGKYGSFGLRGIRRVGLLPAAMADGYAIRGAAKNLGNTPTSSFNPEPTATAQ